MRRLGRWIVAVAVWLFARRSEGPDRGSERERIVPPGPPAPRAELVVVGLLLLAALSAAGFIAVYAIDRIPDQTQFLGISLGAAFAFIAAALIVTGRNLVVTEELEGEYADPQPDEAEKLVQIVEEGGSRFCRRRLLGGTAAVAGGALGLALLAPAVSLGPAFDLEPFTRTPWRRGRRLVGEDGRPIAASAIHQLEFATAFPEHADPEQLGAPVVVIRLEPSSLQLPPDRKVWAPEGILAFSKICTHAGCAIALYRAPLFQPVEKPPALVCPCHYSTFDPATGGTVVFGPAGRPLPQLPLEIDDEGNLRAAGNFSGPVGPSWWGVRDRKATS
jgi:ubiquinol-cytochrome c reductase iron-sulfur subunit